MRRYLLFFSIIFLVTKVSLAQEKIPEDFDPSQISASQLGTLNIDDLSDAQLRMFMQRFEDSGLSEQELMNALRLRGMPEAQIDKLKQRMATISTTSKRTGAGQDRVRSEQQAPMKEDELFQTLTKDYEELLDEKKKEKLSKIFGYDLFNSEGLTFEPSLNVPTPRNYTLGPGDEVIVDVWGASEQTYQEIISPDGYIKIPNVGLIYLNGLSIERASERIIDRLTEIYAGLRRSGGQAPNTFAQVSLGQVRTIRVSVIGEALKPGTFNISSLSTIGNVLYLCGGPNLNGSLRNIELLRNGKVENTFDVYDFLIEGELADNVRLQDQDIIRIVPYENRVEVKGEVKRPGLYETRPEETFNDLIRFTGGFTENAYSGLIKVVRNNGHTKQFLDLTKSEFDEASPKNGDLVTVEAIVNRFENRVQVRGAVFREGEYELSEGLTLMELIDKAQGLRGDAFLERGTIYRTQDDYSTEVISFNLRDMLKNEAEDIALQREDIVNISSIYDLKEEFYIQVFGEVKYPGVYPYSELMTVEDLLLKAGGLRESASGSKVEVARRVRERDETKEINETAKIFTFDINKSLALDATASDFKLKPFDQVYIRKSPSYQQQINVKVEGEVNYPGLYALKKKDERISDLIERAGGLTLEAFPAGANLIRRTEYNPPKPDNLVRLEALDKLRTEKEKLLEKQDANYTLSETEELLLQRLQEVEALLEEYEELEDAGQGREGVSVRRQRIEKLLENDSLLQEETVVPKFETIGINLASILENPGSKYDLILNDGDIISVPKELETVRMRGEFLYPITVRYDDKYGFRDYVSQAGGFSDEAKKSKSYVVYANGSVDKTDKFLFWNVYPRVERGSEIIVPEKPERRKMSPGEIIAISSSLASIALVISQIANNN